LGVPCGWSLIVWYINRQIPEMNKKDFYKQLIHRYVTNQATEDELAVFFNLLESPDMDDELQANLLEESANESDKPTIKRGYRLWPRIVAAASILLILSIGGYFLLDQSKSEEKWVAQNFKNDIIPGSNSATLTLGNGKVVVLNATANGRLAVQGNMAVKKTSDGKLEYRVISNTDGEVMENTLTTRRKEQYKVVLADGTNVWLNASSSIKYPTQFNGKYRDVTVTGEAYFEVAHNAAKPFRVISATQTIEVLGTHFNVNTYADEPAVSTTLLEGSVKVFNFNASKIIKPGEQAVLMGGQLDVRTANVEETVAWKNGYFRFNKENIESIMRKLSRWYDIDVVFDGPVPDEEYIGTCARSRNISEVLKVLQYSKSVHFKIEGRRITVLK
jgi:transmembrane sensor